VTTTVGRPNYQSVLKYARRAVQDEANGGDHYDRQRVEHDILNHFDGLTNSDDDYDFIVEAIREAEGEYNEAHDVDL
jgi:hypothetical protein